MKARLQISLLLLLVSGADAADRAPDKHSASAATTAASKRQEIQAEITQLGYHKWAGEYYAGGGLGVNTSVIIAPKAGYVFEWHGCLGLYDRN